MLSKEEFTATWSALHNDAPVTGAVAWWLKISYRFGLVATLLRISPNALTILGLVAAAVTAITATTWWAVAFLVLSLFCDGIDGSVAIFQKRQSAWGATLDSVVDRVSEALWLYALEMRLFVDRASLTTVESGEDISVLCIKLVNCMSGRKTLAGALMFVGEGDDDGVGI